VFDPRPMHVRYEVEKLALDRFFNDYYRSFLSVSFHQCCSFNFSLTLLLSERRSLGHLKQSEA
jgi:hypothetical protein